MRLFQWIDVFKTIFISAYSSYETKEGIRVVEVSDVPELVKKLFKA